MNDPYEVLGVSRNASDSEIKKAYHDLVKKYHPDNYADNPLADLASEKMKQINEAYDSITRARASGASSSGGYQYGRSGASGGSYSYGYGYQGASGGGQYQTVRELLNSNRLDAAEATLNGMPNRDAEWYFLRGEIAYRRGWLDEARQNYQAACSMQPGNMQYRSALQNVSGAYTPYRQTNYQQSSDLNDACNICNALLCLNCLCGGGGCGR
ncbi:MAG: DnaJ domain-containing protein [Oscillospiraceae bacterium]|jgi:curved DNA-binding protein CbpA|nr:DnaJ domain-containing protein [Oscillospiraceae bacterium]MBQ1589972.1 DnaJ domain-containing protein [Oscillospiraceae bacterium]MBQ1755204.1 DnaJ domain-containing protein [Oscillospiraceae bacterium]MBQ2144974.1 DnaJ domain-containing protein [Oscillospiraceae bacterium]MBQ6281413.1 DnaJ domain-containing protein [Oscillospiraceae bacterium]